MTHQPFNLMMEETAALLSPGTIACQIMSDLKTARTARGLTESDDEFWQMTRTAVEAVEIIIDKYDIYYPLMCNAWADANDIPYPYRHLA
jgi:hypothetical protein